MINVEVEVELSWPWYCRALLWCASACVSLALWLMPVRVVGQSRDARELVGLVVIALLGALAVVSLLGWVLT